MIQFYKPNPKNNGHACSFYMSQDGSYWMTLIKQESWDAKKKIGSFQKNKGNPQKTVNVKFNPTEIAGFIDSIESNRVSSGYHGSNQIVRFKFSPYNKGDEQVGFSLSVTKESKEDSTEKTSFLLGFYFSEARLLKEHLTYLLHKKFSEDDKKYAKDFAQNNDSQTKKQPVQESRDDDDDLF